MAPPNRPPQSAPPPPRAHRPPSNRNGSQAESADRLQQLEARIASTENELQITFRRIDELQVELDRAIQARPLKRTR